MSKVDYAQDVLLRGEDRVGCAGTQGRPSTVLAYNLIVTSPCQLASCHVHVTRNTVSNITPATRRPLSRRLLVSMFAACETIVASLAAHEPA
jgi:hypothetical protein